MTPYSAAAGGRRSRRPSSRSACLRACSGRLGRLDPLAQLVDLGLLLVGLAELLLDRLELLAQVVLALALVDLRLDLGLDLGAELDHLELAGEDLREPAQPPADVDLLEQLLLLGGRDPQRPGDQVGERRGVVDVGDRELELLRQIGDLLDDLGEGALDVAGQRLELGGGLDDVRERLDARHQVGLLGDVVAEPHPLGPLDEDADRPVRDLEHPGDDPGDADVVELVGPGLVELGVARGDQHQHPLAREDVVDEPHRALLADRQRGQRVRIGDHVLERQHRQRGRAPAGPAARGSPPRGRASRRPRSLGPPSLALSPGSAPSGRSSGYSPAARSGRGGVGPARAKRQLDPQDAVLVGGLRLLGDHVGVQLDDAPERPRLDLDLLVDAALGLLHRALAADHQLAARRSRGRCVSRLTPGELDLDDRPRWLAAVVDVDARREARLRAPRPPAALAPDVAEQLVHLAAHALEVDQQVSVAGHGLTLAADPGRPAVLDVVDGALSAAICTGAPKASEPSLSAQSESSSSEMWVRTTRRAPARRA